MVNEKERDQSGIGERRKVCGVKCAGGFGGKNDKIKTKSIFLPQERKKLCMNGLFHKSSYVVRGA
jgi:hypothetical protein